MVRFGKHTQKHLTRHVVAMMFVRASLPAAGTRMCMIALTAIKEKEAAP